MFCIYQTIQMCNDIPTNIKIKSKHTFKECSSIWKFPAYIQGRRLQFPNLKWDGNGKIEIDIHMNKVSLTEFLHLRFHPTLCSLLRQATGTQISLGICHTIKGTTSWQAANSIGAVGVLLTWFWFGSFVRIRSGKFLWF